jgi:hypothetical protein
MEISPVERNAQGGAVYVVVVMVKHPRDRLPRWADKHLHDCARTDHPIAHDHGLAGARCADPLVRFGGLCLVGDGLPHARGHDIRVLDRFRRRPVRFLPGYPAVCDRRNGTFLTRRKCFETRFQPCFTVHVQPTLRRPRFMRPRVAARQNRRAVLVWFGMPQDEPKYERFAEFDWRGALFIAIGFGSLTTLPRSPENRHRAGEERALSPEAAVRGRPSRVGNGLPSKEVGLRCPTEPAGGLRRNTLSNS